MAISMRLSIRRRIAVATGTRLPRYARNDRVGKDEWFRAHGVGFGALPLFRPTLEPRGFTLTPTLSIKGEGVGNSRTNCFASRERGTDKDGVFLTGTHLIRHREERRLIPSPSRDVAISMRLKTRRRTAVATTRGLPSCARNDRVGTH